MELCDDAYYSAQHLRCKLCRSRSGSPAPTLHLDRKPSCHIHAPVQWGGSTPAKFQVMKVRQRIYLKGRAFEVGRGPSLESEKCRYCGASVKKKNLQGHLA